MITRIACALLGHPPNASEDMLAAARREALELDMRAQVKL